MATRKQDYQDRITVDPNILVGKPVITGTRIPVSLILNLIEHGYDFAQIIEDYPNLTADDIRAALAFAQDRVNREDVFTLAS
jgi:uncharacterized protein (DUF433 family)